MNEPSHKPLPIPADDGDRKLLEDVRTQGRHIVLIEADDEGPAFGFTVGLHRTYGHPEVILFGLRIQVIHALLDHIGDRVAAGSRFDAWHEADELLEGRKVIFAPAEPRHYREYLGYACWFHQGTNFPVLQCLWPDAADLFPWNSDFSPQLVPRQPLLSDDRSWTFPAGKNRAVITTLPVMEANHPILLVVHDAENDFHFLCGTTSRSEDLRLAGLGDIVELDPTVLELGELPAGWMARRTAVGAPWTRQAWEPEESD